MQDDQAQWPPKVGDKVRIRENNVGGTVDKTKGVYEARFRLHVLPTTPDGSKPTPRQSRAAKIASRWYGLDELAPLTEG